LSSFEKVIHDKMEILLGEVFTFTYHYKSSNSVSVTQREC